MKKNNFVRTIDLADMSVEEQQEFLTNYTTLSEREKEYFDIMLARYGVLNIVGKPGMAKSAIARNVAKKMHMAYIDVRLSMVDETDVGLFPHLSEIQEEELKYYVLDHAVPRWARVANMFPTIIHFEELNRASLAVRNAALQLLLEKEIGADFKFNRSVLMLSSGNMGEEDGTDVEEFDGALNNRLIHMKHDLTPEEWITQYAKANIHPLLTQYIHAKPEEFYKKANNDTDVKAYATPRTWEMLSEYIITTSITKSLMSGKTLTRDDIMKGAYDVNDVVRLIERVGHGYIGNSVRAIVRYLQETMKLSIKDILSDFQRVKEQFLASNRDKKSELLNNMKEIDIQGDKLKPNELKNLIEFLSYTQDDECVAYLTFLVDTHDRSDLKKEPFRTILSTYKPIMDKIAHMS